jgi:hypothetical protein
MGDPELSEMLERATAHPSDDFVERMLTLQRVDATSSTSDQTGRVECYVSPSATSRSSRGRLFVAAAAALVVLAGAVVAARAGDQNPVAPVDAADPLSVEVDGEPVPASDLDAAADTVGTRAQELGLGPDEVQVEIAAGVLLQQFFAEVGRTEGAPITEADIDEALDGAESIERNGRVLTPDEVKADPQLRAEFAAGLAAPRGMAVLTQQLGSPGEGPDAEARWRAWFSEQLEARAVVVTVDGTEIGHAVLADAVLFLGPA